MWLHRFIKKFVERRATDIYLKRLTYAKHRIAEPIHEDDITCEEREFLIEIITWLIDYYVRKEHSQHSGMEPATLLDNILSIPCEKVTQRDHVHSRVLYHWLKYKRVEGF